MNTNHKVYTIKSTSGKSKATFSSTKLKRLILNEIEIISEENDIDYLLSGSYLCFPWVGRITSDDKIKELTNEEKIDYPFREQNNFPLHGLYARVERKLTKESLTSNSITFTAENQKSEDWPIFLEEYIITDNSLEVKTFFNNPNENKSQYFAYGYHPYIGINRKNINNLILNSNVQYHCKLNSKIVPEINEDKKLKMTNMQENAEFNLLRRKFDTMCLDDLFYYDESSSKENPYVELTDQEDKISVIVESDRNNSIPMNYFQLYTPERRNCVAIEPLSSPSNAFNIDFPNYLVELKPKESKEGKFKIILKNL
jgi:aldose 1-epimerase